jgi:hypothetical protein
MPDTIPVGEAATSAMSLDDLDSFEEFVLVGLSRAFVQDEPSQQFPEVGVRPPSAKEEEFRYPTVIHADFKLLSHRFLGHLMRGRHATRVEFDPAIGRIAVSFRRETSEALKLPGIERFSRDHLSWNSEVQGIDSTEFLGLSIVGGGFGIDRLVLFTQNPLVDWLIRSSNSAESLPRASVEALERVVARMHASMRYSVDGMKSFREFIALWPSDLEGLDPIPTCGLEVIQMA